MNGCVVLYIFLIYFDMEKRKKCQKENEIKLVNKKSKAYLTSSKWF